MLLILVEFDYGQKNGFVKTVGLEIFTVGKWVPNQVFCPKNLDKSGSNQYSRKLSKKNSLITIIFWSNWD